jgi:hypothetical protein
MILRTSRGIPISYSIIDVRVGPFSFHY